MILSGKPVVENIYSHLKGEIQKLSKKPKLGAILVGCDPVSKRYIAQKQKWAEYIGMDFELFSFDENISQEMILQEITKLNLDENISGYIVQLPLPKHIDAIKIIDAIDPKKDVDGFHPINQGKIVIGDPSGLPACTPAGIIELCQYYNIDIEGKNITIIGRSNIVGKPLANLLINLGATVSICNSKTQNIEFYTKNADIIITAMGVPKFLTLEKIHQNAIIIDVGFSIRDGEISGDADFENISQNGNNITPVPGGVGLLTVALLLKNTLKAHNIQHQNFF